jgi:tetratricopeptide (TPR) repeat protein
VDILLRLGRREAIRDVSLRVLRASRSRYGVRLSVARAYLRAGLWQDAVAEFESLAKSKPGDSQAIRRMADAVYLSGDTDRAEKLFSKAAQGSANPGRAWTTLGAYYLERGDFHGARSALERAVEEGAGALAQVQLGVVLVLAGEYDAAVPILSEGLAASAEPNVDYALVVAALAMTPRRDLALRFGREGLGRMTQRGPVLSLLARYELRRGEVPRGLRDARAWAGLPGNAGAPFIELLLAEGQDMKALEVLRSEVQRGDSRTAEGMLFDERGNGRTVLEVALDTGGLGRFPLLYRPLLQQQRRPTSLHEKLGLLYAERERGVEATIHLHAASSTGALGSAFGLGRIHLGRGEQDLARASFTRYVHGFEEPDRRREAMWNVILTYFVYGDGDGAEVFARSLVAADTDSTLFIPVLTEVLLVRGALTVALDLIRHGPLASLFKPPTGAVDQAEDAVRVADLLDAVRRLSAYGFGREATVMLADVAAVRPNRSGVSLALVQLLSRHRLPGAERWAGRYVEQGLARAAREKTLQLDVADAYLAGGAYEMARDGYERALVDFDAAIAKRGLGGTVYLNLSEDDDAAVAEAVLRYRAARQSRLDGARDAATELIARGAYRLANRQLAEAVTLAPLDRGARSAYVRTGYLAGVDDVLEAAGELERLGESGARDGVEFGRRLSRGPRTDLAQAWWARVHVREPANVIGSLERARSALLLGKDKEGVGILEEMLDASRGDPVNLAEALELLAQLRRWSDVIEIQRGRQDSMTRRSHLLVGAALYATGRRKEALASFDLFVEGSADPMWANLEVARVLRAAAAGDSAAKVIGDAGTYVQRARDASPDAPLPLLRRGELRLIAGDKDGAVRDFDAYLAAGGYRHALALADVGRWLLEAGHVDLAGRYLLRLARVPGFHPGRGLKLALWAFEASGRFREGLRFVRRWFPELARNPQVVGVELEVANLHQGAGDVNAAAAIYEAAMTRSPHASVFMNNLAYLLAESGQDLTRAEGLARRALASPSLSDRSRGTYLDTLAWIHRKQGKLEMAREEQETALRLIGGDDPSLNVLFVHLADILEESGQRERAQIARRQAGLYDERSAPFRPSDVGFDLPQALFWRSLRK